MVGRVRPPSVRPVRGADGEALAGSVGAVTGGRTGEPPAPASGLAGGLAEAGAPPPAAGS
ncbi:hypothetical protein AB0L00_17060 [Actinoallomurus sp. NPDC052308]|uniref:hypothetical protein n=1 Tax=Actinoallomurus sp. NPDC052308 TaxID=3155530 RepID=UPI0034196623